ncbi:N-alpha-acetyltransferase 30A isoform X1 [Drosophila subobscura]|uniref:N-alpha-acetyltransferase 30A isoform X1 n=1 Tax=Drosophila subobscura TaxID=7241 RepID=UPI00155AD580|nr:N-alpha-acetyltransferase 30A isoform X1 [Drosophila subobscura]
MINDEIAAEGKEPAPKYPPSLPVITYTRFADETELKALQGLIESTLSEPYTLYTYRYFVYQWPELCFFARHEGRYVGVVVCKLEPNGMGLLEGYIAMLAVDKEYRKQHIGRTLVIKAIEAMVAKDVDLVVLEAEYTNKVALALYESLGFIREKRFFKHYGNGADAFRLTLGIKNIMLPFSMECYEDD